MYCILYYKRSWILCIQHLYHVCAFFKAEYCTINFTWGTRALKLNLAWFSNCLSQRRTLFASRGEAATMHHATHTAYQEPRLKQEDDVALVTTRTPRGPCIYDPMTWNTIPPSPALHCPMMRWGYWRPKVNYQWLDFIKVDLPNWGLSQSGGWNEEEVELKEMSSF